MADIPTKANLDAQARAAQALLKEVAAIDTNGNKILDGKELLTFVLANYQASHRNEADPFKPLRDDIAAIRTARDLQARYNKHDPAVTPTMVGLSNEASEMAQQRLSDLVNVEPDRITGALLEQGARARDSDISAEQAAKASALAAKDKADAATARSVTAGEVASKLPQAANDDPRTAALLEQMRGGDGSSPIKSAQEQAMRAILTAMRDKKLKEHPENAAAIEKQFAAIPVGEEKKPETQTPPETLAVQQQIRDIRQQLAPYRIEGKPMSLDALEDTINSVAGKKPLLKNERSH